ncbi:hypothetical protein T261_8373 [Streptomyces lydicus]|nr:hypothetical protein T261_8373 [Streptomyces lydicus]
MFPDSLERPPSFHPARYTLEDQQRAQAVSAASETGPIQSDDVREWARRQGYDVAPRGRIPGAVLDAYKQAHR